VNVKEEKAKKDEYQKALAAYSDAMKEFRKEKFEKASEMLANFLEKYSTEKELADRAKIYIAICGERAKENREPISLKTAEDYYQHGVYKTNSGEFEEALKSLEKALKMSPDDGKIYYSMANLYCLMGQADPCLENLKKAIQADKFFRILAQNETDFEPLWEDKKFKLITRMT
jgi:tetratricopeptide (TPR) repeat protein